MSDQKNSHKAMLTASKYTREKEYWLKQLSGDLVKSRIHFDFSIEDDAQRWEEVSFTVPLGVLPQLMKLRNGSDQILHMILMAEVVLLVYKYTQNQDLLIGTPIYKQEREEDFINTILPFKMQLKDQLTFKELLMKTRQTMVEGIKHQNYPMNVLSQQLEFDGVEGEFSLFEIGVVLENIQSCQYFQGTDLKLVFIFQRNNEGVGARIQYDSAHYARETIVSLISHLDQLFKETLVNLELKVGEVRMLSEEEERKIRTKFNDTDAEYRGDQTIHQLFEEQVERRPDQTAIIFKDQSLTYRQLNQRANQLARLLREKGVQPDTIVGLLLERSLEMMVGIMAVLKAGGAYLPIHPHDPKERIQYMLDDSQVSLVLAHQEFGAFLHGVEILSIDHSEVYQGDDANLEITTSPENLVYVIYTSGSTGKPKGVMIEHHSLVNRLNWMQKSYSLNSTDIILQKTPYTFDVSVWEIFWWAIEGATVCFLIPDGEKEPRVLVEAIEQNQITVMHFVPSMLNAFLEYLQSGINSTRLHSLKQVYASGESLTLSQVENFQKYLTRTNTTRFMNLYGPTEATIDVSYFDCTIEGLKRIPIGQPIDNIQLYVMNQNLQLLPIGVPGELCIGGIGLARGYLNRLELTQSKFVQHPDQQGQRLYRTGDLARRLPDGNIEFLGRIDHQVKIRGFRIELGEIENQLLSYPGVTDVVVVTRTDATEDQNLVAFYVARESVQIGNVKEYLAQKLPQYMIPTYFQQLAEMPLTSSGKVNRKVLPEIEYQLFQKKEYLPPQTENEQVLHRLWQMVLGTDEKIGVEDHFFDLGGHSLKAAALVTAIHKEFQVEISLKEVIQHPTILKQAAFLQTVEKSCYTPIPVVEKSEWYPVSSSQLRLILLHEVEGESIGYNMPVVFRLEGELDHGRLEKAIKELIQRHESLRTSFQWFDGEPMQKVDPQMNFEIQQLTGDGELDEQIRNFIRPFDLKEAPLFRVGIITLSPTSNVLILDLHHLITDGISQNILVDDFVSFYRGDEIAPLSIQYKDFATWQQKRLTEKEFQKQEQYWLEQFAGELPMLNLPTDHVLSSGQPFAGEQIRFEIDNQLVCQLQKLAREYSVTLYMVLLAVYKVLLHRYTNQTDLIVGTPTSGRYHADLERVVGMFVDVLPIRSQPVGMKKFEDFLREMKEIVLENFANQEYPFEELIHQLKVKRDRNRNPLFDTMFVLQNMEHRPLEITGLNVLPYQLNQKISKFDLTLIGTQVKDKLQMTLEYSTNLFTEMTIRRMTEHYTQLLIAVVKNPMALICDLELITEAERRQLEIWNDTRVELRESQTIHQLFERQVELTPNQQIIFGITDQLTYHELNQEANKLARVLRKQGVRPNRMIGVLLGSWRSKITAMLAVLKSGGAYVPIDPDYPEERIRYMLEDSQIQLLIIDDSIDLQEFTDLVLQINDPMIAMENDQNLDNVNTPHDAAYVIYTSGTTGMPKGAVNEHHNVLNMLHFRESVYQLSPEVVSLQVFSYSFDGFVTSFYPPLIAGAKIVFLERDGVRNLNQIREAIVAHQVTHLISVPSLYQVIIGELTPEEATSLQVITLGGDQVPIRLLEESQRKNPQLEVINAYGVTEAAVMSTVHRHQEKMNQIRIGRPIWNTRIYILNEVDQNQPIGVPGELCIAGHGVAREYLNQPELSQKKFVEDPFVPGERMYRSGDLARWLADGNLEFLGRIDNQVKVRGYRIEVGEIESQLLQYSTIREAVVLVRDDQQGGAHLVGYFVATSKEELRTDQIKEFLGARLPQYMIPKYLIQLEEIPLTTNGKIDTSSMPEPQLTGKCAYLPPESSIEVELVKIWQEVLGQDGQIGVLDNFFEVGGDSLRGARLLARIQRKWDVEVSFQELMNQSTLRGIADLIQRGHPISHQPIEPIEKQEMYPLSFAQKRLYLLDQLTNADLSYHIPAAFQLHGKLELERLNHAFQSLIQRHELLRTSFVLIDGEPMQQIHEEIAFELEELEAEPDQVRELILEWIRPFELHQAPLFRGGLIRITNGETILVFDIHHIISDGSSISIMVQELTGMYNGQVFPELRIQYKDIAYWQKKLLEDGQLKVAEEYWLNRFRGEIPKLNLPLDYARTPDLSSRGRSYHFQLDRELTNQLKEVAQEGKATLYMVLLAALNTLLYRYTGQEDLIVGTPVAGRTHVDLEQMLGMFVNTLALRTHPQGKLAFREYLSQVKKVVLEAFDYQDFPFEMLVEKLHLKRSLGRNPLFDVLFILQNQEQAHYKVKDLEVTPYSFEMGTTKFDLTVSAIELDDQIKLTLEYREQLFKQETIARMAEHLVILLADIVVNPDRTISNLVLFSPDEKAQILQEFNPSDPFGSSKKSLVKIFEGVVTRVPDQTALIFKDQVMTYQELNQKANQLARSLLVHGVQQNQIVGIMVESSFEMIIGIWGILKSGAAYLPIDPTYPEDRINFMLKDAQTQLLLTQSQLLKKVEYPGTVLDLNDSELFKGDSSNLTIPYRSSDLAYVIYTSGTTGTPKGTLISQYSVLRVVKDTNYIEITEQDCLLQLSNYAFDGSIFDIFGTLLNGAQLVLVDHDVVINIHQLTHTLEEQKVTVFFVTTALFNLLVDTNIQSLEKVRKVLFGGERVSVNHAKKALNYLGKGRLIHVYGPTESTVFASFEPIDEIEDGAATLPIGRPLLGTQILILDANGQIQPLGIPGEICISGIGLAQGYLNQPELTREKFVQNTFQVGELMYKTGDLARWLSDGRIEFIGRFDDQVKIRGFRIELGEIENQLLNHPEITEAVVVVRDENMEKTLIAYFVAERELSLIELKEYLVGKLPEYMIPLQFIHLATMPLTPNGKLDKAALPEISFLQSLDQTLPKNELEELLVGIWQDVLGIEERIGVETDFFELGGHSLRATQLVVKIHKELEVQLGLKQVIQYPTIRELARLIQNSKKSQYQFIEPVEKQPYYPLSSAQKRLFVLDQLNNQDTSYNIPGVYILEGDLNHQQFKKAIWSLTERQESLRTSFAVVDGEPVQIIHDHIKPKVEYYQVTESEVEELIGKFIRPFDLKQPPLWRVGLIETEKRLVLLYDLHHSIADGSSLKILVHELNQLYLGKFLPKLRVQYKDIAIWQNQFFQSDLNKDQERYWLNQFSGEIPVLSLPTDFPRPTILSSEGDLIKFTLDEELSREIGRLARNNQATLYMILLAAYNVFLYKYTGQEDIIVGSPIAGRPHADLEQIIGMFVNTLAIRSYPTGIQTFTEFVKQVKTTALDAYENQDFPFEKLIEKLDLDRGLNRNPLFDTMFVLQNMEISKMELGELSLTPYETKSNIAKFDLLITVMEENDQLQFWWSYSTQLFTEESMRRWIGHFINLLRNLIAFPEEPLAEVGFLTDEERSNMITKFNQTQVEYSLKPIHRLFEEQVARTPDFIAVRFKDTSLTYRELNQKANQLARHIRSHGAYPLVGLMVERSFEMMIGLLGILKAGAGYLPIDPEYPAERIQFMLQDSQVELVLTQPELAERVDEWIDLTDSKIYQCEAADLPNIVTLNDLIYMIYTSGSTGKPKGAMLEHRNLSNLLLHEMNQANIDFSTGKVLQFATISFDVSFQEIFSTLIAGGELQLIDQEARNDIYQLLDLIQNEGINILFLPAAFVKFIFSEDEYIQKLSQSKVNHLITAGEQLVVNRKLRNFIKTHGVIIHNHYGPSETHVVTTLTLYPENRIPRLPSIGRPVANTRIYILDSHQQPQPVGVIGELCIAGAQVGRGYHNQEQLTSEKFVEDPFFPGERMYQTGDLARWLADGKIEFIGRNDHQVKIRGFRVELGEVESLLLDHSKIKEVAVIAHEDEQGQTGLVAYIVCASKILIHELREYLLTELPDYMVPSNFVFLETMPLTANGKINRLSLPKPNQDCKIREEFVAPTTELEIRLANIWSEVLGISHPGINDNFFELGGHSLKAMTLTAKINQALGIHFSLRDVFQKPTIKAQAADLKIQNQIGYQWIPKNAEREVYPVSSAQKRIYILHQLNLEGISYNMPGVLMIKGELDKEGFHDAIHNLIQHHVSLRTSFELRDGQLVQKVHQQVNLDLGEVSCQQSRLPNVIRKFVRPFDLSQAPLVRMQLVQTEEMQYLIYDLHHIISDGISTGILQRDLGLLYNGEKLSEHRIQYTDYAIWQNQLMASERFVEQEEYWLKQFAGEISLLEMPIDGSRSSIQSNTGDHYFFQIDAQLTARLKKLAVRQGVTLYMVILAIYNILVTKYSGQEDIIIGTPTAGRSDTDLQQLIGMFVNTLPLRNRPTGVKRFVDFLSEVKETTLAAFENQDYQFEMLIEKLNIKRDANRNPLFDLLFVFQNMDFEQVGFADFIFVPYSFETKTTKFDLTLSVTEVEEEIHCGFEYRSQLFLKKTIQRLADHLLFIASQIVDDPECCIDQIELVDEQDRKQILMIFNDSEPFVKSNKSLSMIFEEVVSQIPDQIALIFEDVTMTYRELNQKANQLAHTLRAKGISQGQIVGMMVEPSFEMMIGIWGILKAGGAYLPIDPTYPEARVNYMLQDTQTQLLLTQTQLRERVEFEGEVVDLCEAESFQGNTTNPSILHVSSDLAYIIYTSGTTGQPKGALIPQYSVSRVVKDTNYIEITTEDRILQLSNYAFDGSVFGIFGALLNGAQLVMVDSDVILNLHQLIPTIQEQKITLFFVTTALFNLLVDTNIQVFEQVRKILFGGERVSMIHTQKALNYLGPERLIHVYGPTESTVFASFYPVNEISSGLDTIPIGRPLSGTQILILNEQGQLQPPGVPGEICISGSGLAIGYLNQTELTQKKFVINPYQSWELLYKTGDLGKWLSNGNIEFIGRVDDQVKIRGFRIELGEIEKQLLSHAEIQEAIVVVREEKGEKVLIAYLVADQDLTQTKLKEVLVQRLPDYMIPTYFVQLSEFPLTSNGKIDKGRLPKPERFFKMDDIRPKNDIEELLVRLWQQVLGIEEEIGVQMDFFDLGGHSLKATQLVALIHKELDVQITLKQVMQYPTICGMARLIQSSQKSQFQPIEPVKERSYYPLLSAQQRIFFLDQFAGENINYNIPAVFRLNGKWDKVGFTENINMLIERHIVLRTSFTIVDGKPMQQIAKEIDFQIEYLEVTEAEVQQRLTEWVRPFDLYLAPLFRVALMKISEMEAILALDFHHIIADGTSLGIFIEEFVNLSGGGVLEPLKVQYTDYAVWQQEKVGEQYQIQKEYWLKQFADEIPILNLPIDYERSKMQDTQGSGVHLQISKELTDQLIQLGRRENATLFMILLAAYNTLLYRYSGQEDIIVGSPIACRPHADLEKIMGMFVNTLALRNRPIGTLRFRNFLIEVKENALQAYQNQEYQFEDLVSALNLSRDLSRNPLFDTMFILQNQEMKLVQVGELEIVPYPIETQVSKFDLTCNVTETPEGLVVNLEYRTTLFKEETIKRLGQHFEQLLVEIVKDSETPLQQIDILTVAEKERLWQEWKKTYVDSEKILLHELFEVQVQEGPDRTAIICQDQQWTYAQLNQRANQFARFLREKGVTKNQFVAIMVESWPERILGILAVLKAGGAYLPIDSSYPEQRIRFMLTDSEVQILITDQEIDLDELVTIHPHDPQIEEQESKNLNQIAQSEDVAYLIYTSGTTGEPKGVINEHQNVVNMLLFRRQEYQIDENSTSLQLFSYSFDGFLTSFFTPIISGGKVVLLSYQEMMDLNRIREVLVEEKVTHFISVPSLYQALIQNMEPEDLSTVQVVTLAGESFSPKLIVETQLKNPEIEVVNEYGLTEAAVMSSIHRHQEKSQEVRIGYPIWNTRIYILNEANLIQPVGVPGELCIAGKGLARGYLHRPELTEERFVADPFFPGEKMYRSGDLARWDTTGKLQYLGRMDEQVKLRGFRIELAEIESHLTQYLEVQQAVALLVENQGDQRLIAYFVAERELSETELRRHLHDQLPEYMIPSIFVQLAELPKTPNGKIDKGALHAPIDLAPQEIVVEPETELEKRLASIWQEMLGVEKMIGVNDNFFSLGGDSIKALQIAAKLHDEQIRIQTSDLFERPTISQLSQYIMDHQLSGSEEPNTTLLLTPQQNRLLVQGLSKLQRCARSALLFCKDGFEVEKVQSILDQLVKAHMALRLGFKQTDHGVEPVFRHQKYYSFKEYDLFTSNLTVMHKLTDQFKDNWKPEESELLRIALFHLSDGDQLVILAHHLLMDQRSLLIVVQHFTFLYQGKQPVLTETDLYQKMVGQISQRKIVPRQEQFCTNSRITIELTHKETEQLLVGVHSAYNTQIDDLLLTTLYLSMQDQIEDDSFLLNVVIDGRVYFDQENLDTTIGAFELITPLILEEERKDLSKLIKATKEKIRQMKNEAEVQVQSQIGYQSMNWLDENIDFFDSIELDQGLPEQKYKLFLSGNIIKGRLNLVVQYSSFHFTEAEIGIWAKNYRGNLYRVIQHCLELEEAQLTVSDVSTFEEVDEEDLDMIFDELGEW